MSNGSMQFLGRQLAEQAKQLGLLVEKMELMIQKQDQTIPKYAIESDTLKHDITVANGIRNLKDSPVIYVPYVTGNVKVKFRMFVTVTSVIISINGTKVLTRAVSEGIEETVSLAVSEGDVVVFTTDTTAGAPYMEYIKIFYDEGNKPGGVIS